MDGRAIVVGLVLTAAAIAATWFGRFPLSYVGFAAMFTIPLCCVAGAVLGGAGAFAREFYETGVSISVST